MRSSLIFCYVVLLHVGGYNVIIFVKVFFESHLQHTDILYKELVNYIGDTLVILISMLQFLRHLSVKVQVQLDHIVKRLQF